MHVVIDLLWEVLYWLLGMLMVHTHSLRVAGTRRIPHSGPVLLIANHQSYLDILPLGLAAQAARASAGAAAFGVLARAGRGLRRRAAGRGEARGTAARSDASNSANGVGESGRASRAAAGRCQAASS